MKQISDTEIIQAALDAELCFPRCWYLIDQQEGDRVNVEDWTDVERERMRELRRFATRIAELAQGPVLTMQTADPIEDSPSTPNCCDAWPAIRNELSWFSLDDAPNLFVMPCVPGTNKRVNHCPSCGADRRAALWNTRDD